MQNHIPTRARHRAGARTEPYDMTATKKDLVKQLQTRIDASNKVATDIVDALLESISDLTHTHGKLIIRGFGKFEARRRAPRLAASGFSADCPVQVPAKVALCFTASPEQVRAVE